MYSLRHGLRTLPAVPRSTQPSILRGTVKWVSAFGLSNNNKWQWWTWMVTAIYQRTHSLSRLAWSEGWRPPGAQSAFIKWTGWTLAVTIVMRTAPYTLLLIISIIIITILYIKRFCLIWCNSSVNYLNLIQSTTDDATACCALQNFLYTIMNEELQ